MWPPKGKAIYTGAVSIFMECMVRCCENALQELAADEMKTVKAVFFFFCKEFILRQ